MSGRQTGGVGRWQAALGGALAIIWLAVPALARNDAPRAIAEAFDDAPLVLHVRDASRLRGTAQFKSVLSSLDGLARFEVIGESWLRLSASLAWDEDEAFDRLLGESFAVVIEDTDRPDSWTVICEVSKETARHISRRLRVVPKSQVAGVPVFGIEGDRIAAATVHVGDSSILVLTRDQRLDSFGRAIRLARRLDDLRADESRLPEGQIVFALRGYPAPESELSAGATQRGDGWHIVARLRSPSIADELVGNCHLWLPPQGDAGQGVLFQLHLPTAHLDKIGVTPLAAGVRARDDRPGLSEFGRTASITGRATTTGDLSITLAVGIMGRQRSAAKGDAIISALIARLGGGRIAPQDFGGLYPDAMRVSEAAGLDPLIRGPAAVSWAYVRAADAGDFIVVDAAPLGETDGARHRITQAKDLVSAPATGTQRAYASIGWIRLGEAIERAPLVREFVLGEDDPPSFLRSIKRIAWQIWRDGPDEVRAEFELDLQGP